MATVTAKELRRRVKLGAHFLDTKQKRWALDVRLPELKMQYTDACILGQVYGDYDEGLELFGLGKWVGEVNRAIRYGLSLRDKEMNPKNWSALAEAWALEVAVRQVHRA